MYSAHHQYRWAAERGHAQAALYTANMLFEGVGVQQNVVLSKLYYNQAAEADIPEAMNSLALILQSEGNLSSAATWFYEATKFSYEPAVDNIIHLLSKNDTLIQSVKCRSGEVLPNHEVLKQFPSVNLEVSLSEEASINLPLPKKSQPRSYRYHDVEHEDETMMASPTLLHQNNNLDNENDEDDENINPSEVNTRQPSKKIGQALWQSRGLLE